MAETDTGAHTGITLTVRLIKSFKCRTFKNLVLHGVSPAQSVAELLATVKAKIPSLPGPWKQFQADTLKVYVHAHQSKTSTLIINLDKDDELLMRPEDPLSKYGVADETELSFFMLADYLTFKADPTVDW